MIYSLIGKVYTHNEVIKIIETLSDYDMKSLINEMELLPVENDYMSEEYRLKIGQYIDKSTVGLNFGVSSFFEVPIVNQSGKPYIPLHIMYFLITSKMLTVEKNCGSEGDMNTLVETLKIIFENSVAKNHVMYEEFEEIFISCYLCMIDTFMMRFTDYAIQFATMIKFKRMTTDFFEKLEESKLKMIAENKNIEDKILEVGEKINEFNKNLITIMALVLAAFSVIGFNIFTVSSAMTISSVIIMNLSLIFGLSTIFAILDYMIFNRGKVYLVALASGVVLSASLAIFANFKMIS